MRLLFATGNRYKFDEAEEILDVEGLERVDLDYPELQSDSLETVAREGANWAFEKLGEPVIVEDSGLFVDALDDFPGPYSSYVYRKLGNGGILRLLDEEREAGFSSVVAYADADGVELYVGEVRGVIAEEERGRAGFGFDPIFVPEGRDRTFAEDLGYKNEVSHRRKALESLAGRLKER